MGGLKWHGVRGTREDGGGRKAGEAKGEGDDGAT